MSLKDSIKRIEELTQEQEQKIPATDIYKHDQMLELQRVLLNVEKMQAMQQAQAAQMIPPTPGFNPGSYALTQPGQMIPLPPGFGSIYPQAPPRPVVQESLESLKKSIGSDGSDG